MCVYIYIYIFTYLYIYTHTYIDIQMFEISFLMFLFPLAFKLVSARQTQSHRFLLPAQMISVSTSINTRIYKYIYSDRETSKSRTFIIVSSVTNIYRESACLGQGLIGSQTDDVCQYTYIHIYLYIYIYISRCSKLDIWFYCSRWLSSSSQSARPIRHRV